MVERYLSHGLFQKRRRCQALLLLSLLQERAFGVEGESAGVLGRDQMGFVGPQEVPEVGVGNGVYDLHSLHSCSVVQHKLVGAHDDDISKK